MSDDLPLDLDGTLTDSESAEIKKVYGPGDKRPMVEVERDKSQPPATQLEMLRRIAGTPNTPALVCDGCRAVYVDDEASDSESCDVCGRFKQRMEWAECADVAAAALRIIDSLPSAERFVRGEGRGE